MPHEGKGIHKVPINTYIEQKIKNAPQRFPYPLNHNGNKTYEIFTNGNKCGQLCPHFNIN